MTTGGTDGTTVGGIRQQLQVSSEAEINAAFLRMIKGVVEPDFTDAIQVIIKIKCADAREVGRLDKFITELLRAEYAIRGVVVPYRSMSIAGAFMTHVDTIPEVKGTIHNMLFNYGRFRNMRPDDFRLIVQLHSHGDVVLKDAEHEDPFRRVYYIHELKMRRDSASINCGMRGAGRVWRELIDEITSNSPVISYYDKDTGGTVVSTINSDTTFLSLLKEVYNYQEDRLDEFVSSIRNLIKHPRRQKDTLKESIRTDRRLGNVKMTINGAMTNYEDGTCFRVDGNVETHSFLDDAAIVRRLIYLDKSLLPDDDPERINRTKDQKDIAKVGIFCHDSIPSPRNMLAKWLSSSKKQAEVNAAGGVFATAISDNVLHDYYPFSPYQLVAFYYAVKHLGIKDHYLVGNDRDQCEKISSK